MSRQKSFGCTKHASSPEVFTYWCQIKHSSHTVKTVYSSTSVSIVELRHHLSKDSTDWYDWERGRRSPPLPFDLQFIQSPPPPFKLQFVQAGSRRGWSWCTWTWFGPRRFSCEINWLDPEPSSESGDYETYIEKLQDYQHETDFYRGYHEPPTEEEYRRLCEGLLP
jgi:hypothetical protein